MLPETKRDANERYGKCSAPLTIAEKIAHYRRWLREAETVERAKEIKRLIAWCQAVSDDAL